MYNLNQLWTFMRVAELGSFHKVSREAYMSPNAIMKQINNLEEELGGIKLFERTRAGNELTEVGRYLYEDAEFIIKFCAASQERIINMVKGDSFTIRLWVSYGCPISYFQDLWDKIQEHHPEINLCIESSDNKYDSLKKLWFSLGKTFDIAFNIGDKEIVQSDKYNYLELTRVPLMALLSKKHPLAAKDVLTTEDLKGETVFALTEGWANNVTGFCKHIEENHPEINIEYKEFYGSDVYNTCANGSTILLSPFDITPVHPFMKAIPLDWPDLSSYGFIYSSTPTHAVEHFITAVKTILKEDNEK